MNRVDTRAALVALYWHTTITWRLWLEQGMHWADGGPVIATENRLLGQWFTVQS